MEHANSSSEPPEANRPKRAVRGLAIVLGLAALVLFGFSLFFGAWVVFPFCGIIGWVAYGLWTGTTHQSPNGKPNWQESLERLDTSCGGEWSSVPGNINHEHYLRETQPPPPS